MSFKEDLNLSTDAGTNVLAVLAPVLTYVLSLPDGWMKQFLVALCVTAISVNLYLIKGCKERDMTRVDDSIDIQDVLDEGRE
jgi:hypothetical protein